MNKIVNNIVGIFIGLLIMVGVTGCNLTSEQVKVIAHNAGLGSAVTWIAYDNPNQETKDAVIKVLDIVNSSVTNVVAGKTYVEVLYPLEQNYVMASTSIKPQYKPLVLSGSLALLNGIDIMFALHPEWTKDIELSQKCVIAFVRGAKAGLEMPESDPAIKQAKIGSEARAKIFKTQ